jgi:hypothetical protein
LSFLFLMFLDDIWKIPTNLLTGLNRKAIHMLLTSKLPKSKKHTLQLKERWNKKKLKKCTVFWPTPWGLLVTQGTSAFNWRPRVTWFATRSTRHVFLLNFSPETPSHEALHGSTCSAPQVGGYG